MDNKELKLYFLPESETALNPEQIQAVRTQASSQIRNITEMSVLERGYLQSANFVTGTTGWQLLPNGNFEGNNGTFRGTITATTGAIGGFSIGADYVRDAANSFGLASTVSGGDDIRFWAGDTFANRATAPFRVSEAGAVVAKSISIGGATIQYTITNNGIFSFGDGSDGAGVADGATALAGATLGGGTYTLTRDVYFTDLTVSTGVTINPAGYRIFGTGTLTENGTGKIARNGNNGSSSTTSAGAAGGAALADGYLKGSLAGAAGGNGANGGGVQNGVAGTSTSNSIGSSGAAGGRGGEEILGTDGGTGGAAGTANSSNVRLIANWHLATLLDIGSTGATVKFDNSAASGGGGGGNRDATSTPGGGGGGAGSPGGIIAIYFRVIVINASASITANGGSGGSGAGGASIGSKCGGGGGGGGGNGGQIILVYNTLTNSGSLTASAGTAGTGGAGGVANTAPNAAGLNGTAGTAGTIRQFQISL